MTQVDRHRDKKSGGKGGCRKKERQKKEKRNAHLRAPGLGKVGVEGADLKKGPSPHDYVKKKKNRGRSQNLGRTDHIRGGTEEQREVTFARVKRELVA